MPVKVLISIVKDWYEWLVSGLVHLLSNDPFRRTGLMPCRVFIQAVKDSARLLLSQTIGSRLSSVINQLGSSTYSYLLPLYHLWLKIDTAQHSTAAVPSWRHTYSTMATGQVHHHGQVTAARPTRLLPRAEAGSWRLDQKGKSVKLRCSDLDPRDVIPAVSYWLACRPKNLKCMPVQKSLS